ncbi:hypothetical protein IU500_23295 [Nocardia terpenica]|uniref:hypothetical protein n=1 Tax=Nocardia terpenica TaxID=455432 RepID=UPI001893B290|nr:hypothetical protein [Nocardia terpenica]MBF6064407.1 hypothetical protein [Nocardia terpenica]MBF6106969.1 hypothetical protein [Nocardia terpenica]MBF6114375.1 hypothetical protein [Nocardia terpenica]MBF6121539.1 hypothetical protein [Nocardia terpenica]MBF6153954.1 hypothetical protein [Nocardia terpenica]
MSAGVRTKRVVTLLLPPRVTGGTLEARSGDRLLRVTLPSNLRAPVRLSLTDRRIPRRGTTRDRRSGSSIPPGSARTLASAGRALTAVGPVGESPARNAAHVPPRTR